MGQKPSNQKTKRTWSGWFILGPGIKRWLILISIGALVFGLGICVLLIYFGQQDAIPSWISSFLLLQFMPVGLRIFVLLMVGSLLLILAIIGLSANLLTHYRRPGEDFPQTLSKSKERNQGPKIVAIGGGTGLPSLLRGLTAYTSNITAIVTVADDGGSSGRLRRELGMIPPGDFRNNIAALAKDEALMTQLLQYRFGGRIEASDEPGALRGHAFGNLLLAALSGVTGSFDEALTAVGDVLAMTGQVLPSTLSNVTLVAMISENSDSELVRRLGESSIPAVGGRIDSVELEPANVPAYPLAVKAILKADLVAIGPGSLYTSILPNLLVPEIAQALIRTRAKKLFICNLATQPGETDNYGVADHVEAINRHVAMKTGEDGPFLDLVLANNNLSVPPGIGGGNTIFVHPVPLEGLLMINSDLVDVQQPWRHDGKKLAQAVVNLV
jgi:uncharacterized cofD-like protein